MRYGTFLSVTYNDFTHNGKKHIITKKKDVTDKNIPGYYLASIIYGPSYLSFECALAYYSLIPETVYTYTSATFEKKKAKQYENPFGAYTYRDVPSKAYPLGVNLYHENGYSYQIASAEKAVCDQLYIVSPVNNQKELEKLLFDDLRIDSDEFFRMNLSDLLEISSNYRAQNHKLLQAYTCLLYTSPSPRDS